MSSDLQESGSPHIRIDDRDYDADMFVDGERASFHDGYGDATEVRSRLGDGKRLRLVLSPNGLGAGRVFEFPKPGPVRHIDFESVDSDEDDDLLCAWESPGGHHRVELRKRRPIATDGGTKADAETRSPLGNNRLRTPEARQNRIREYLRERKGEFGPYVKSREVVEATGLPMAVVRANMDTLVRTGDLEKWSEGHPITYHILLDEDGGDDE